jgi:hypothetical protein
MKTSDDIPAHYRRQFMVRAVEHLLQSLKNGTPPVSSGVDGAKAVELIVQSRISARRGGRRVAVLG